MAMSSHLSQAEKSHKLNILISGAGIAGCVCAFWLNRAGIKTTIIERAPELRKAGQQIDIRGAAAEIIKQMGVDAAIRAKTTREEGLAFVDGKGRELAVFPADGDASFTCDIEILRERLVKVFYDATKPGTQGGTEYIFGDHVIDIEQGEKVKVTLASGKEMEFDLVLGGDGMSSKTRRLTFPNQETIKHLGQYTSFFTIPYKTSDGTFAKWYNAPGGRSILLRPDNAGCTRAYLSIINPEGLGYYKLDIAGQKKMIRAFFTDAGWEAKRVLDGIDQADDFYMQETAQVKMPSWSKGRVALIGDAGYCPSPVSGMGTTLAIIGAYILAGEIAKNEMDHEAAFKGYEEKMRPYVDSAQSLPPGVPHILSPQTWWGVSILNLVLRVVYWTALPKLFAMFSSGGGEDKNLPLYDL